MLPSESGEKKCDPVCPDGEVTSEEMKDHVPNVKNMRGHQYF